MYSELLNKEVCVYVTSRTQDLFEYHGTLEMEDAGTVELKDVSINAAQGQFGNSLFGSNITKYKSNIEKVIINKKYIISMYNE